MASGRWLQVTCDSFLNVGFGCRICGVRARLDIAWKLDFQLFGISDHDGRRWCIFKKSNRNSLNIRGGIAADQSRHTIRTRRIETVHIEPSLSDTRRLRESLR